MAKRDEREAALILRTAGKSVNSIAADLGVSVSTVSRWVADIELTSEQVRTLVARPQPKPSAKALPPSPAPAVEAFLHPQFALGRGHGGRKHHTKQKGDIAEAMAQAAFVASGYMVSRPFSENCPYDLVVDDGRRLARVQVKHARYDNESGTVRFSCRRASRYVSGGYSSDECDFFAAWCSALGTLYVIPHNDVETRSDPHLRVSPGRNGQRAGIR